MSPRRGDLNMLATRPRGTIDVLPGTTEKWQFVEQAFREVCRTFGYGEIRTPMFEHTELFERGVGETTDIVEKEMYTFVDRGGRSVTLKPEGTAPTVRAYLEHRLLLRPQPVKLYYIMQIFRYERPQAGRQRQHQQFGVEVLGSADPAVDAEVIAVAMELFRRLGLRPVASAPQGSLSVLLNSVGCPACRPAHREALTAYFHGRLDSLCRDCVQRFGRNPLRILDCKREKCREAVLGAPKMLDYLCDDCAAHFEQLTIHLADLQIPHEVEARLVRGLDYYTKTAFEIVCSHLGAQSSICGGGRYDGLVEVCGGPPTPGVGFGLGVERLILALEGAGVALGGARPIDVFVASAGGGARREALRLLARLRAAGMASDCDYGGRNLRAQMKLADRLKARFALIVGEDEMSRGVILLRDMVEGTQAEVNHADLLSILAERARKQECCHG